MYVELANTLIALVEAMEPPPGAELYVTAAEIDLPLEVSGAVYQDRLIFLACPPLTIWKSGVLPTVHKSTLRIEIEDTGA